MQRRKFLKGAIAAGVAGAAATKLATPALAQGKRELKMVTTWPKNFPGLGTSANRLAKTITDLTDGALGVKVFAAGELVPPFEAFDAVASGTADIYHAAEYYWQGKSRAFNFFTAVPFGLTAAEIDAWIHHGGAQKLWDDLSAGFNIKPFVAGNTGVQMGGWFRKEVNTLDDWKGLKFRMPGLGGEVLRRMGAAAVNLPGGEIFPALQSGAIDGTEWVGPWNDLAFGFYKVAKFYYYPGFHEPGSALSLGVNKKLWDSLSPSQKRAIETAAAAENNLTLAEFNARNNDALDTLKKKHNVQLRKFSDTVIKAIGEISGQVVAEAGKGDAATEKVYASFIDFRRKAISWSQLAEQAYGVARSLPFKYGG
jgi:TRAP-type mannitol/chloroaromatic compound transport system substrate-binding protein